MTEIPSYMIQNPIFEPIKPKKRSYFSSSFIYMIFLSIFTYVLIFHIFEISPFSIVKDTKILFFISNTLILIIAADYGAFSDKENHDVYGEYINNTRNRNENYTYQENTVETEIKNLKEQQKETFLKQIDSNFPPERILKVVNEIKKPVIANQKVNEINNPVLGNQMVNEIKNPVLGNQMVNEIKKPVFANQTVNKIKKPVISNQMVNEIKKQVTVNQMVNEINKSVIANQMVHEIKKPVIANQRVNEIKKPVIANQTVKSARKPKPYGRSKSDKQRLVRNKMVKNKRFDRTESDKSKWIVEPEKWENVVEESEEYSKLSNEELNKKVEDFIQNFNREIRLQSLRS